MHLFFFGERHAQLYGAYEPPARGGRGAAVICAPLAAEYQYAHRALRVLSGLLAASGYHVLRFDYLGYGDSAGNFEETNQADWLESIRTAIAELKDLAGMERVTLVGLRYGATMAAMVADGRRDVERLVLWDPVVDGRAYVADMVRSRHRAAAENDMAGVTIADTVRAQIEASTPALFALHLPPTLLLETTTSPDAGTAASSQLEAHGTDVTLVHAPDVPPWSHAVLISGGTPALAMRTIASWLA